ncbi:hypothetical protein CRE_00521 [Caenorhabditis remanei]|uniref:Uncharacterized protein n=1 Tax=Caenorhabditis remanei TaxID=31234 RepID=E3LCN0_CAERE|nr:hypothetical protein CRE_00521 [Caenorhabditis remanei]
MLTISFCLLLSFFYLSAVIDPSSYAAEQIEIVLADKVQYFADLLNTTPQTGMHADHLLFIFFKYSS